MAQEQARKDEDFDLAAEIRRMAAVASGEALPAAGSPPPPPAAEPGKGKSGGGRPPPLPLTTRLEAARPEPPTPAPPPPAPPAAAPAAAAPAAEAPAEAKAKAPAEDGAAHGDAPEAEVPATKPRQPAPPPAQKPEPPQRRADRRAAKRRAAAPSRDQIAANDDAPSIGGLIYALNQKPSARPFAIAAGVSIGWALVVLAFGAIYWGNEIVSGAGLAAFLGRPEFLTLVATVIGPIGIMFGLAMIAYRSEEMRLRSSAMTEVAVRLAEPDRMAEQSVASLGQAVRRQVSFMNDAVARALGRAGELEALVHNEVSALERSYEENERKIRALIQELSGERDALVNTSERVTGTLRTLGSEVPELIDKLSSQQIKLAKIIEGAGQNLISLETAISTQTGNLETALSVQTGALENVLGSRTQQLQSVLTEYTAALSSSLDGRMEQIGTTIASRTGELQVVFEEYTRALDSTLAGRSQALDAQFVEQAGVLNEQLESRAIELDSRLGERVAALDATLSERAANLETTIGIHTNALLERTQVLDMQLIERTQAINDAFSQRLVQFDEAILRSTAAIDQSVGEKTLALGTALENHARSLGDTLQRQSLELDENLLQGINAVRRSSENITRQSIKAIEGLAGQSELLRNVSENLLNQINSISNRFDNQGQQIMRAANALETANYKIDKTLQNRHTELVDTLDRMALKADELGSAAQGYSRQIEGSVADAEQRARSLTAELAQTAEERSRATLADIERLKSIAADNTNRALEDLRSRFSHVSDEVTQSLGSITNQFTETTGDARRRASEAAALLASEQERLRNQIQSLPGTTRESADTMRRMLQDQLRALDQLSQLTNREAGSRDVSRPVGPPTQPPRALVPVATSTATREEQTRALSTLSSALSQELQSRARSQPAPAPQPMQQVQPPAAPAQRTAPPAPPIVRVQAPTVVQPATLAQAAPVAPVQVPLHAQAQGPAAQQPPPDGREGWSLGDLLKRASLDDDSGHASMHEPPSSVAPPQPIAPQVQLQPQHAPPPQPAPQQPPAATLDIAAAARALDPATASAIWQRLGSGQRGIMVRSIYTAEGRALFDETVGRITVDPVFAESTQRYLADFERVLHEADRQDPSGQTAQSHLVSDYGRVYLFLAHANGRIG